MSPGGGLCDNLQDSTGVNESEGEIHFVAFIWGEPSLCDWLRVLLENIRWWFHQDSLFLWVRLGGNTKAGERLYNAKQGHT